MGLGDIFSPLSKKTPRLTWLKRFSREQLYIEPWLHSLGKETFVQFIQQSCFASLNILLSLFFSSSDSNQLFLFFCFIQATMGVPLTYTRPKHVDAVNYRRSQESLTPTEQGSVRSDQSTSSAGIPDSLAFDNIINGGTCPVSNFFYTS